MKTTKQIAKECNLERIDVYNMIRKHGFVGTKSNNSTKLGLFFNKEQEDLIHQILFFECKIDHVIFESKMNKPS